MDGDTINSDTRLTSEGHIQDIRDLVTAAAVVVSDAVEMIAEDPGAETQHLGRALALRCIVDRMAAAAADAERDIDNLSS